MLTPLFGHLSGGTNRSSLPPGELDETPCSHGKVYGIHTPAFTKVAHGREGKGGERGTGREKRFYSEKRGEGRGNLRGVPLRGIKG